MTLGDLLTPSCTMAMTSTPPSCTVDAVGMLLRGGGGLSATLSLLDTVDAEFLACTGCITLGFSGALKTGPPTSLIYSTFILNLLTKKQGQK